MLVAAVGAMPPARVTQEVVPYSPPQVDRTWNSPTA